MDGKAQQLASSLWLLHRGAAASVARTGVRTAQQTQHEATEQLWLNALAILENETGDAKRASTAAGLVEAMICESGVGERLG